MATYRIYHARAGVNTANSPMWEIKNIASRRTLIREIGIFCEVAATTPPQFRVTRSTALGITPVAAVLQPGDQDSVAAATVFDVSWGTPPTFTTAGPFYDGFPQFNTPGQGVIYTYQDLWVRPGTGAGDALLIVNLVASGATTGTWGLRIKVDE
jgi:hypothetical protein